MRLDAVICTYNRPEKVNNLVQQILQCPVKPSRLIVVDASDKENNFLRGITEVEYIRSERKSQPYQRFIGSKSSEGDIICFFDDDVQIINDRIFEEIIKGYSSKDIAGVSAGVHYENGVPLIKGDKKQNLVQSGKISWLGRTTGLPKKNQFVEYFPGPIMSFKKEIACNLFDEYMFSLFEKRIAMGEDKAISMRASTYGKLLYLGQENFLYHPPEPSTYYVDIENFYAKSIFSRLWLNKVFAEVRKKPIIQAYLLFVMFMIKHFFLSLWSKSKVKGYLKSINYLIKH